VQYGEPLLAALIFLRQPNGFEHAWREESVGGAAVDGADGVFRRSR
jgi:hypothetical protein